MMVDDDWFLFLFHLCLGVTYAVRLPVGLIV